jgi:hypothetical protein
MNLEEISPERFLWEYYDPNGVQEIDDALRVAVGLGYCDASRLQVRPRSGLYALMVEWPDGAKAWYHITPRMLELIRKRLARKTEAL